VKSEIIQTRAACQKRIRKKSSATARLVISHPRSIIQP
jgi:hypothetical protein